MPAAHTLILHQPGFLTSEIEPLVLTTMQVLDPARHDASFGKETPPDTLFTMRSRIPTDREACLGRISDYITTLFHPFLAHSSGVRSIELTWINTPGNMHQSTRHPRELLGLICLAGVGQHLVESPSHKPMKMPYAPGDVFIHNNLYPADYQPEKREPLPDLRMMPESPGVHMFIGLSASPIRQLR